MRAVEANNIEYYTTLLRSKNLEYVAKTNIIFLTAIQRERCNVTILKIYQFLLTFV